MVYVTKSVSSIQFFFRSDYNIFTTNFRYLIITGYNLNLSLKLIFCPSVKINNNLTLKICYKSIVNVITFIILFNLATQLDKRIWIFWLNFQTMPATYYTAIMYMCGGGGGTLQANISIHSNPIGHIITTFIALLTLSAETEPVTPLTLWSNGETCIEHEM